MRNIRAVLFDMDGLLLDTESLNMQVTVELAQEMGITVDPQFVARNVFGKRRAEVVAAYAAALPDGVDVPKFYEEKNRRLRERIEQGIEAKKGALELLTWLTQRGIPCVLATATASDLAEKRLRSTGLWELLPLRVTGDMTVNGKPHPETYLRAAELAGIHPSECLVLEDSFNGIRAGRAAGAVVGMVPDLVPYDETCAPYCDAVFEDLTQVIGWLSEE